MDLRGGFSRACRHSGLAMLLVGLAPVLTGCAHAMLTPERQMQLGAQAHEQYRKERGLVEDAVINNYVAEVGHRLAEHAPLEEQMEYQFFVVDAPEVPNATAAPGGYIHVYTGLLTTFENEAQLAAVLGHEIGHITQEHYVQRLSQAQAAGLAQGILAQTGAGAVAQLGAGAVSEVMLKAFSREREIEADLIGVDLMWKAGYNPEAAADVWQIFYEKRDTGSFPLFSTHPPDEARVETLREYVAENYPEAERNNRPMFDERYQELVLDRLANGGGARGAEESP